MENNITININFNNVQSDDNILLIQYLYDCLSNYTYIDLVLGFLFMTMGIFIGRRFSN